MKKISIFVLALLVAIAPSLAFAGSGSAHVNGFRWWQSSASNFGQPNFMISNITDSSIDVTVTIYDDLGTIITDGDDATTTGLITLYDGSVTNYDDNPTGASVSFTLAANDTTRIRLVGNSTAEIGYAHIEWTQSSDNIVGLIASVRYLEGSTDYDGVSLLPINSGMPF